MNAREFNQEIFRLISDNIDLDSIKQLISTAADSELPWLIDPQGRSALHLACLRGDQDLVRFLLDSGLPYNAQDNQGKTAAEYALCNGHHHIWEMLVGEAVRSEMILLALPDSDGLQQSNQLNAEYLQLPVEYLTAVDSSKSDGITNRNGSTKESLLVDSEGNGVMMDWERQLMLRHAEIVCHERLLPSQGGPSDVTGMQQRQIDSLRCKPSTDINTSETFNVLNVGFGLGIIDGYIDQLLQEKHKRTGQRCVHWIIEAHPDVLQEMSKKGWHSTTDTQPELRVLTGRWQDAVNQLYAEGNVLFDGIFYDTFAENYESMRQWHDHVINLLRPSAEAVYSFFNGLGGTNPFFHEVYCRLVEIEMSSDMGMSVDWEEIELLSTGQDAAVTEQQERLKIKRPYFTLPEYRLPSFRFANI